MRHLGRLTLGALLAVLVMAGGAAAQKGEPVEGGGSFTEAPLVQSGNYSDSIRMSEELFYAVELAEDQALRVTARMIRGTRASSDAFGLGRLQIYNSLRDLWTTNDITGFTGATDSEAMRVKTPEIGAEGQSESEGDFFSQPGTFYFSLRFTRTVGAERESPIFKQESKTRLKVRVVGAPIEPSPSPIPTAEPSPTESAAAAPADTASGDRRDTPYVRVYLTTFLIGLLVGFALIALRGFASRRLPPRQGGA